MHVRVVPLQFKILYIEDTLLKMREQLLRALLSHAQGEIEMHKANVEVYLTNPTGIGEHPDITAAMQEEIDKIARWHDQIEVINKYFKK